MYYLCHKSVSFSGSGCIQECLYRDEDPEIVSSFSNFEYALSSLSCFKSLVSVVGCVCVGEIFWISDESGSVFEKAVKLIDV